MSGTLIIISAPSGAGKTSLVNRLKQDLTHIVSSISYTTRSPRPSEVDGKDYRFVSDEKFLALKQKSAFLESAEVFGHSYGTSKADVASMLASDDVVLEIEWQGARQVMKHKEFDILSIYIVPPSLSSLEQRLRKRAEDSDEVIANRLKQAKDDLMHCDEYDFVVINDDFDDAADCLRSIVVANRCAKLPYSDMLSKLLSGEKLDKP